MSTETVEMIRNAEISHQVIKLSVTDKKAMDNLRAYVELMAQQRKTLTSIKVTRDFLSTVMKHVNKGRDPEQRYSGASYKGIPLEAVNG